MEYTDSMNKPKYIDERPCTDCKEVKPFSEFYTRTENGRPKSICKTCDQARWKIYRENPVNQPLMYASQKAWVEANKDKSRRASRNSELKKKYGITIEQYEEMLLEQNGLCAICDRVERVRYPSQLAVDHDHDSGRIRGLLCQSCNTSLGKLDHSVDILRKAIEYLS